MLCLTVGAIAFQCWLLDLSPEVEALRRFLAISAVARFDKICSESRMIVGKGTAEIQHNIHKEFLEHAHLITHVYVQLQGKHQ
jgi:hypothetical protein